MLRQHTYDQQSNQSSEMIIPTHDECWVVPHNCDLVKLLLKQQALCASDLHFSNKQQFQSFIRKLFLLALQDEYQTEAPSPLAKFARAAMQSISNTDKSTQ